MIATVQNTTRKTVLQGKTVDVWEARAQSGARFHLFVLGTRLMPVTEIPVKDAEGKVTDATPVATRFQADLADQKAPASETLDLPASL